ncbi:MAG: ATP-dependent helicase C-terminal domain-containing protein, partial [Termitinemataceae bacterium]
LTSKNLLLALQDRFSHYCGWDLAAHFDTEVPPFFTSPRGTKRRIDYSGVVPMVSIQIQDVFGLAESPKIRGIPLTFELLSPAQRPIQITSDLARFWIGSYAEVRKDMRGRYPKHDWPEHPI